MEAAVLQNRAIKGRELFTWEPWRRGRFAARTNRQSSLRESGTITSVIKVQVREDNVGDTISMIRSSGEDLSHILWHVGAY